MDLAGVDQGAECGVCYFWWIGMRVLLFLVDRTLCCDGALVARVVIAPPLRILVLYAQTVCMLRLLSYLSGDESVVF